MPEPNETVISMPDPCASVNFHLHCLREDDTLTVTVADEDGEVINAKLFEGPKREFQGMAWALGVLLRAYQRPHRLLKGNVYRTCRHGQPTYQCEECVLKMT